MDSGNFDNDSDMVCPVLVMPKTFTTLPTNSALADNAYMNMKVTSRNSKGIETNIYSGICNIKLMNSNGGMNQVKIPGSSMKKTGEEQMLVNQTNNLVPPYSQSKILIEPSKTPYVYNTCDPLTQEQSRKAGELITVEQYDTYTTQNVYNCKDSNVLSNKEASQSPVKDFECKRHMKVQEIGLTDKTDANPSYCDFERGVFLSQLPEEIMNETQSKAREGKKAVPQENSALKQLMLSDIQSTLKQKKTILVVGQDSHSRQTIRNISYNEPLVMDTEMEVYNEVVIDGSSQIL